MMLNFEFNNSLFNLYEIWRFLKRTDPDLDNQEESFKGKTWRMISGAGEWAMVCCDPVLTVVMIWCCCCCWGGSIWCRGAWWRPAGRRGYWTGRRTPSSPRSPGRRESCCRGGRTGPRHRTCGRTPDTRSTPGGRHWPGPSSPSRRRGWSSYRRSSSRWSQTVWGSLSCRGGGSPWCTETGPPRLAWHHSTRTWDTPRARTGPEPGGWILWPSSLEEVAHLENIFVVYLLVTARALLDIRHLPLAAFSWHPVADHVMFLLFDTKWGGAVRSRVSPGVSFRYKARIPTETHHLQGRIGVDGGEDWGLRPN